MAHGPSPQKGRWLGRALPWGLVLLGACDGGGESRQPAGSGGVVATGGTVHTGGSSGGGGEWGSGGRARAGGATTDATGNGGESAGGATSASGGGRGTAGRAGTGGTMAGRGGESAGGATSASGGGRGTGGRAGTGGTTTGRGGTPGAPGIRGLTPQQIVADMGIGWNLGNSFDASPNETSWGNPTPTQAMVQGVKAAGFKTLRVPVTWTDHFGGAPNYTINAAWLGQVERTVAWALDAGMYAIVNTHHDADLQWILLTNAAKAEVTAKVSALWQQIATRFKDYDDHLIFETFNEPHGSVNPYTGGNAEQQTVLNAYIAAALAAIRGTGGNNALRPVMIPPHGASPYAAGIKALVLPDDPNLIVSLHTYYPTGFSLDASPNTWGSTAKEYSDMAASLDQIKGWLPDRAIVIGEWGSVANDQLDSRVRHARAYAQDLARRGLGSITWDNGGNDFGLLNRQANPPSWKYPTVVAALLEGFQTGAAPGAVDATLP